MRKFFFFFFLNRIFDFIIRSIYKGVNVGISRILEQLKESILLFAYVMDVAWKDNVVIDLKLMNRRIFWASVIWACIKSTAEIIPSMLLISG